MRLEVGGSLVRGPCHVGEKVTFQLFGITIFTSLKSRVHVRTIAQLATTPSMREISRGKQGPDASIFKYSG